MANTPLYKYTQLPRTLTTDMNSAYYGAQAQRARRDTQLSDAESEFKTGAITYDDFTAKAQRILGGAIGMQERGNVTDSHRDANALAASRTFTDASQQYDQGQLNYQDYLNRVSAIGTQLSKDITGATRGTPDDFMITDQNGNQFSVAQALDSIRANYNIDQENKYADDYAKGKISFENYSNFLKQQLGVYEQGTSNYEGLGTVWEDAYKTELDRYYATQKGLHDAGQITENEWSQFNKWYGKQVGQGAQQSETFTEFTPTENKSASKDLSSLSLKDLNARLTKQQTKLSESKGKANKTTRANINANIDALKRELNSRKK